MIRPTRQRLSTPRWQKQDPEVVARYAAVREALRARGLPPAEVALAVTALWNFVGEYHRRASPPRSDVHDLSQMDATREGCEVAHAAWKALHGGGGWSAPYTARIRTRLAQALAEVVPGLARVIQPDRRSTRAQAAWIVATRSGTEREFDLLGCLPREVRRLEPRHPRAWMLRRVAEHLTEHLKSLSWATCSAACCFWIAS